MNGRIKRKRAKRFLYAIASRVNIDQKYAARLAGKLAREWCEAEREHLRAKRRGNRREED